MIEIIGKNGAGKSFVANKLYELGFNRSINYTTREKRNCEIEGIDYNFVTIEQFKKMLDEDFFIEYKIRNGNYYGTPKHNMSANTVLLAGNTQKITKLTGIDIVPMYIDCDIEKRYERVKKREKFTTDIFVRFHIENFCYLEHFEGFFIDNNNDDYDSLNNILKYINKNGEINDKCQIKSNGDFISEKINKFTYESITKYSDQMLLYLAYEEFILRKIYTIFDFLDETNYEQAKHFYFNEMNKFLLDFNFNFNNKTNGFYVKLNGIEYESNFHDEKIKRK